MNRKLYALIVISILLFGCSDRYEQAVYNRMDYYLDTIKPHLDEIALERPDDSGKTMIDLIEERKKSVFPIYYDVIESEEMVKELAELYFSTSFGATVFQDRLSYYKPYYVKKYKNFWILYGCTNLRKTIKKDWKNFYEYREKLIFIDGNNGKLILIW